jgi:hypothetical protein
MQRGENERTECREDARCENIHRREVSGDRRGSRHGRSIAADSSGVQTALLIAA